MHEDTILAILMAASAGVLVYWDWRKRSPTTWRWVTSNVPFIGFFVVAFLVVFEAVDEAVFLYAGTPLLLVGAVARTLLEFFVGRHREERAPKNA